MKISQVFIFVFLLMISVAWANEAYEEESNYLSERFDADVEEITPEFRGIRCPKSWKCKAFKQRVLKRLLAMLRQHAF
uniref:Oxyopinin-4a n=1 Tax=Oxyopes takobius TaxID=666126 RepID=TOP4A_OXYTA|nr:RecName: Full=Oxyopinin-4a; Short=Oxt-4a; Flags: Precursor [Oxyopes takobius]CBQ82558.1 oxyopinin 4a precursor [Oxyopes takobius]